MKKSASRATITHPKDETTLDVIVMTTPPSDITLKVSDVGYDEEGNLLNLPVRTFVAKRMKKFKNKNKPKKPKESKEELEISPERENEIALDVMLKNIPKDLMSVLIPVSITLLVVITGVKFLDLFSQPQDDIVQIQTEVFGSSTAVTATQGGEEDVEQSLVQGLLIAGAMIITMITCTFGLYLLFKYRCERCITCLIVFVTLTILSLQTSEYYKHILRALDIPFDSLTAALQLWNFGMQGKSFYNNYIARK